MFKHLKVKELHGICVKIPKATVSRFMNHDSWIMKKMEVERLAAKNKNKLGMGVNDSPKISENKNTYLKSYSVWGVSFSVYSDLYELWNIDSSSSSLALKLIIIIISSCTHTAPPGCLRSCAAASGRGATPNSPASSRPCCAGGAGSSSWTRTRPPWSGCWTGPAGRCPRRDGESGGPRPDKRRPRGRTGPPPGTPAPGRRSVELTEKEEKNQFRREL